jgi:hypothetical protein
MKLSASPNRSYRSNNSSAKRDALFCEWKSYTHNRCHKPGDPGLPFCAYRSAATVGMARGASSPDSEKRAKFEQVWEHFADAEDDQEGWRRETVRVPGPRFLLQRPSD